MNLKDSITEYIEFSSWHLRRERKEVERDPRLRNIKPPDHLRANLMEKIKNYEADKAEREKLLYELAKVQARIVRFEQPQFQHMIKAQKKRRIKYHVTFASMLIMILSCGTIAIAAPEYVRTMTSKILGNNSIVSSGESSDTVPEYLDTSAEADAYEAIKEALGFSVLPMPSLTNMSFDSMGSDITLKYFHMFYKYNNTTILYSINVGTTFTITDESPITTTNFTSSSGNTIKSDTFSAYSRITYIKNDILYCISGDLTSDETAIIIDELLLTIP